MIEKTNFIHESSFVEQTAKIGNGVKIWHNCHIRSNSVINELVSLGKDVFVDKYVEIGRGSRIQNGVSIYQGVVINKWCFVGPHVTFTNDLTPRAGVDTWKISKTYLASGSSIGAGSIINSNIKIGCFALIGAGSVVTADVPAFCLSYGLPARTVSRICACGITKLDFKAPKHEWIKDCCKKRLITEVLDLAKKEIDSLK